MKKLMFAAVAAAMAGVTVAADCGCECEDPCSTTAPCMYAYEVILLAKTTSGKPVTAPVKQTTCGCEEVDPCGESGCYRKPLMRKFAGFIYGDAMNEGNTCGTEGGDGICGSACKCVDFSENENQVFWDVKTKKVISEATLTFEKIDAIGYKSRETVEAFGTFAFEEGIDETVDGLVTLAGFGTRGKRANGTIMLKNLSGFFAGYYPCLCSSCEFDTSICGDTCSSEIALPWCLCSDELLEDDDGHTAAYGKWMLKWNETAAQKLTKVGLEDEFAAKRALTKPGYQVPTEE